MSGSTRIGSARAAAAAAFGHVREAAAKMKPYASGAQAAAGRGTHKARAFAAPRVERAGQAVEDSLAPKVSAMLSSAAQRLEPAKPRRRRWRKLAGISLLTAAAGAAAATFRDRAKQAPTAPAETATDTAAPTAEVSAEEEAGTGVGADADGQVRTS